MIRPLTPLIFGLTVLPTLFASVILVLLTMQDQSRPAQYAAVLALSYLLGSVPWGYMLPLWRRGVDIREYGSGRTGMTNVLRSVGVPAAALVLLLDMGKAVLAVVIARVVSDSPGPRRGPPSQPSWDITGPFSSGSEAVEAPRRVGAACSSCRPGPPSPPRWQAPL